MISGKIGSTVIAQEELANLFTDSRKDHPQYPQFGQLNINPNQKQNIFYDPRSANTVAQSRDPLQFIRFKYTNPLKPQVTQDVSFGSDMMQLYNSIQIPVINNLEKLLQNCESMRDNYQSLLAVSQELNKKDGDKGKSKPTTNQSSNNPNGPWGRASNGPSNTKDSGSNSSMNSNYGGSMQNAGYQNTGYPSQNQGYPSQNMGYSSSMKISSTAREQDIHNFIAKFQCTRATAIGYLEAFGSFELAAKEYQNNV